MKMQHPQFATADGAPLAHEETNAEAGQVPLRPSGKRHTGLADGRQYTLTPGMSFQVADNAEPHRSISPQGATLFILD